MRGGGDSKFTCGQDARGPSILKITDGETRATLAAERCPHPPLACTFAPFKHALARERHNHRVWDESCLHQHRLAPRGDVSPCTSAGAREPKTPEEKGESSTFTKLL